MSEEQWRPVPGYPDYEVSNLGRLVSHRRPTPYLMRPCIGVRGYRTVRISADGVVKTRTLHSLVAEAFHGPCPEWASEVRHLNGDYLDNRAVNLKWGTRAENRLDSVQHRTHVQSRKTHCPSNHPYDDDNTYVIPSRPTARYCRTCHRNRTSRAAFVAANVSESAA